MKTTYLLLFFVACVAGMASCSKLDNYDPPSATIFGSVIDSTTNTPILTEQPNGFQVRLIEQNYKNPNVLVQNFFGKADGTFERSRLFAATYKVIPIEGAFFPLVDTAMVTVASNGRAEINFKVMPYLSLDASAKAEGNNIIVTYKISRQRVGHKITERKTLCSVVPTVSNTVWYKNASASLSSTSDDQILATTYTDTIKDLPSGTYYVCAAARTANPNNRFNYSPVFKITIP